MAIKGYSAFPKAPTLLQPHHQIVLYHIRTLVGGYPSAEIQLLLGYLEEFYSLSFPSLLYSFSEVNYINLVWAILKPVFSTSWKSSTLCPSPIRLILIPINLTVAAGGYVPSHPQPWYYTCWRFILCPSWLHSQHLRTRIQAFLICLFWSHLQFVISLHFLVMCPSYSQEQHLPFFFDSTSITWVTHLSFLLVWPSVV